MTEKMLELKLPVEGIYRGELILVNKKHPIRGNPPGALVPAPFKGGDILIGVRAAAMLTHLLREIGHSDEIIPISGYRSDEEQGTIYRESAASNGHEFTRKYVALPGMSEHQTGLAIDLGENKEGQDFICPDFPYTGIYGKFREHASRYGFIERYESGKEEITGIAHEPWHFRYVGYPHAAVIGQMGICLEEYIEFIKNYRFEGEHFTFSRKSGNIAIFYEQARGDEVRVSVPENMPFQVSGNNDDGFIVTVWKRN